MNLRPYQEQCIDNVLESFERSASTLVVMPTGTGKTVVCAGIMQRMMDRGRVMFLAHREELIFQAADRIEAVSGIRPEVEMASFWANEHNVFEERCPVIVSSVQTQCAAGGKRRERFSPSDFGLLVVDEAHHATAGSYRRVIDHYRQNENLRVLGLTATPDRHDEEALGQVFDSVAFDYEILDAIHDGWLVPIGQQFVMVDDLDYSGVGTVAGDFNQGELSAVLQEENVLHRMAVPTLEIAGDRKGLVFAASVNQAEKLTDIFNRYKPNSAFLIHGKTDKEERRTLLRKYAACELQFMVNVGVATEGFDMPDVEVVVMGRPTKSRALYCQMVGRGTRPLKGVVDGVHSSEERRAAIASSAKPSMMVLDFVGNAGKHKLMTAADILGGRYSDREIARANDLIRDGKARDVQRALRDAKLIVESETRKEQERARRDPIRAKVPYSTKEISPFDVLDIEPHRERGWERGAKASEAQAKLLEKFGVRDAHELSKSHAGQLITNLIQRRQENRCTFKQAQLLRKYGYSPDVSFAEARRLIDAIAANGWQKPQSTEGVARVTASRRMAGSGFPEPVSDLH